MAIARAERTALALAAELIPALADGLTESASERICTALLAGLDIESVAINGPEIVIYSCGEGMDHHLAGGPYRTSLVGRALAAHAPTVARTSRQIGCAVVGCPLTSGVAAPIVVSGEVVGLLSGWRTARRPLSRPTIEAFTGLAALFAARLAGASDPVTQPRRDDARSGARA